MPRLIGTSIGGEPSYGPSLILGPGSGDDPRGHRAAEAERVADRASTQSPTLASSLLPQITKGRVWFASIFRRAISVSVSVDYFCHMPVVVLKDDGHLVDVGDDMELVTM